MSGGGSKETSTTSLPSWAVPYAQDFLQRSQQQSNLPYQQYGGQTLAGLNPYQTAGLEATAQRAMQGSPVNGAASSELQRTLSGGYLGAGNPYMDSLVDRSQGDLIRGYQQSVIPQLDMMAARSGSFGNTGVAQTGDEAQRRLIGGLGDISTSLRGGAYESERNRMQGAVGMAPQIANQDYVDANALQGVGGAYRAEEQLGLDDQLNRFNEQRDGSLRQLQILGGALNGGNYGSTTTGPGANRTAGALGGAASGAMIGSSFGPWGTAAGAVGGGLAGGK